MNLPLVWLTLFYLAGILVGTFFPAPVPWIFLIAEFAVFLFAVFFRRSSWFAFLIGLAFFLFGGFAAQGTLHLFPEDHLSRRIVEEQKGTVRGIVVEKPELKTQNRVRFVVEAFEPARGKMLVTVYRGTRTRELEIGEKVEVTGKLRPVPPGGWGNFLRRQRILTEAVVWGGEGIRSLGMSRRFAWRRACDDARAFLEGKLVYGLSNDQHRQILQGLVFGSRGGFSPELTNLFRRTNTYHVLAVSGFNMMLVITLMTAFLNFLRLPRRFVAILMIVAVFGYMTLLGWQPSATRAGLMSILALWAWAIDREVLALNTVAVSALIILLFSPMQLFLPGFQLSYIVVIGLVFWSEPLTARLTESRWREVVSAVSASIVAWLVVIPPILNYFGTFTPYSILTNLVILLFVSALTYLGLAAMLFNLISENIGIYLSEVNAILADSLLGILHFFEKIPGGYLEFPKLPDLFLILFYFAMLLTLCVKMSRPS